MRKQKTAQNFLDYVPCRRLDYTLGEDGIVRVMLPHNGFFDRIVQRCFKRPKTSEIALDALGSFVWLQIDGVRNVHAIGLLVQTQFGESCDPLYERLSVFFAQLRQHGFLTLE